METVIARENELYIITVWGIHFFFFMNLRKLKMLVWVFIFKITWFLLAESKVETTIDTLYENSAVKKYKRVPA